MKRCIIVLSTLFFLSVPSKAQFILTPTGLTTEDEKGYYVESVEGKSQQELFDLVQIWVGGHFVSPKDVISTSLSGAQITINAIVEGVTKLPNRIINCPVDMNFSWQILFKDGKIRFNVPTINSLDFYGSPVQTLYLIKPNLMLDGIFKKDGKLLDEYSKKHIEGFFNGCIEQIVTSLNDTNDEW